MAVDLVEVDDEEEEEEEESAVVGNISLVVVLIGDEDVNTLPVDATGTVCCELTGAGVGGGEAAEDELKEAFLDIINKPAVVLGECL